MRSSLNKHTKAAIFSYAFWALFLILLLKSSQQAHSATIKNLSIEQGLSNRRVYSSVQDQTGYLWFATRTNIDRYDGEKFDHYILSNNENNRGVVTDQNKKIYAFTDKTVYQYDDKTDSFQQVFTLEMRQDNFNGAYIINLFFSKDNTLIVCTSKGVLLRKKNKFHPIEDLNSISVYSVCQLPDNLYLFGTAVGIKEFRYNGLKWERTINKEYAALKGMRIQSLYYDKKTNTVWIGTFANGLFVYNENSNLPPKLNYKTTLPIKVIKDIADNEIWAGCDGEGVFVFDRYNKSFKKLLCQSDNQDDNIGANGIYDILEADEKVWISTYSAGVFVVNTKSIVDMHYRHQEFNRNSLIDDHVNVIYEDHNNNLWFGTNKGLSFYNTKSKIWNHYLVENKGASTENSVILSVMEDNNGFLWVGGYATHLSKINLRTGQITTVNNMPGVAQNGKSYIYAIQQDEDGNIWLGGSIDKLKEYSPLTNTFKTYNMDLVNKIMDYSSDYIYLGTMKGIYILNKRSDKISLLDLRKIKGGESLISRPFINNIVRDPFNQSILWIGTENFGMIKYNTEKQTLDIYNTSTGLSSDYVYGLLFDDQGRLWITTENGLDCFDPKTNNAVSFFAFDGLNDNTFNFLSYVKLRNGKMLLGTPNGVNEINPDKILTHQNTEFNLHFKGFYLFYEKMKAGTDNSPLKESIDNTRKIELSYSQNSFSIDFINLDINNLSRTLYSWKLEGFDDEWSKPSPEHKAVYTNIPAGDYHFMVKAIRMDTNNESEIRSIEIKKYPPFWANKYAYFIYFILLAWLAYFIIRFWLNKVDARFTQDKIKFFSSMAHEIRTPITLVKAPLNELDNEHLTMEGRSALDLARRNTDKLFGLVTQLLDFQKLDADAMNLNIEETLLSVFIENIINNFKYLARSKEIDFKVIIEAERDITVWIDRNKIQIMLENLISNALKYTAKGGYVSVKTELSNNRLILLVSDNGIGIPAKAHDKLFRSFYRAKNASHSLEVGTGIGLMFTKKLAELHKGNISFVSSENVGSTFKIEIPILKTDYSEEEIVRKETKPVDEIIPEEESSNQMHILLVEDNDELRTYLAKMLHRKYSILEAANGLEALKLLESESPDLILSDILMPEMDGFELCQKVKSNITTCHIPLILLTSLSDREDVVKGLNIGADDYITKPFDNMILESKIKAIFNNRALFRKKYIDKSVSLNETNLLNDLNKSFMKKLVELVEKNITNEEFNIDEIAYEMAMSRSVFFKKVKSLTGQNPKDFIRDIKMNKAADLLREQKYSISEISYLIGFPNSKYFSTAFKKYYGISPTTFVEKEKREENYIDNSTEEV